MDTDHGKSDAADGKHSAEAGGSQWQSSEPATAVGQTNPQQSQVPEQKESSTLADQTIPQPDVPSEPVAGEEPKSHEDPQGKTETRELAHALPTSGPGS
jgi:hypothetical protein